MKLLVLILLVSSISISMVAGAWCEKFLARNDKGEKKCQMELYMHIQKLCGDQFEFTESGKDGELHLNTCCCAVGCSDNMLYDLLCPDKKI